MVIIKEERNTVASSGLGQDPAKHPTVHRTVSQQNGLTHNVNSSEVEKFLYGPTCPTDEAIMTQRDKETCPGPYNWLMAKP